MNRVFHCSAGRSSVFMTIKYWQEGDLVIFCDTGREDSRTYEFLDDFEKYEKIPVVRLKYEGGFERLIDKRKAVPNRFKRFCTEELKVKTARRYLRSIGWFKYTQFIGYRYDFIDIPRVERHKQRWQQVETKFPLYEDKIGKAEILLWWKSKPYDLKTPSILGNCDLCFQKGKKAILAILKEQPELADKWIADEDKNGHTYFKGISFRQLREQAQSLKNQYDLFNMEPQFNCACSA